MSFSTQYAVLLGWASELPVMVKMRTLPKKQCPQSEDPDYWDVWTQKTERKIDWHKVSNDWQNRTDKIPNQEEEDEVEPI